MRNIGKLVLALLFAVLVIEILVIAPDDLNSPSESGAVVEAPETLGEEAPNQTMRGLHLVETKGDQKEWELWADLAFGYKKKATWSMDSVKAQFFGEEKTTFVVTGDKGTVELETKNMRIDGNVLVRSSNGYSFRTDSVNYMSDTRELVGPNQVNMTGPGKDKDKRLKLSGDSMKANLTESLMQINGNVKGGKVLSDGRRLVLKSGAAEFSAKSDYARFYKDVTMDVDSMRVSGPESIFSYNSDSGELEVVTVKGGVRVSDRKKWAMSEIVKFYVKQDKFVFRGRPRVVQENDELVGDEIVFLNGGKKVQVLKARARMDKGNIKGVN